MRRRFLQSVRILALCCSVLVGRAGAAESDDSLRKQFASPPAAFRLVPIRHGRALRDPKLLDWLAERHAGGHVIFTGRLPSMSPAKGIDPSMRKRAEAVLASHPDRTRLVKDERRFGEAVAWMAKRVPPAIRWDGPAAVRLAHQREPGREIVLVANPSAVAAQGKLTCTFGGSVSIWNPETGEIREAGKRKPGEAVAARVPADSARFVAFEGDRDER